MSLGFELPVVLSLEAPFDNGEAQGRITGRKDILHYISEKKLMFHLRSYLDKSL